MTARPDDDDALARALLERRVVPKPVLQEVLRTRAGHLTLAQDLVARGLVTEAALRRATGGGGEPPPDDRPTARPAGPVFQRLGEHWHLLQEIGSGGMGTVYEAIDTRSNARCAVKILRSGRTTPEQEERFRREADLGARLKGHPGIVAPTAMGTNGDGRLYCVMDFVEGRSLWDLIHEGVPRERGVALVAEVARAVAYANAHGVIHRDIKPQNVLVTADGRARLTDFGIAKALDDAHGLTATGQVMGTPRFMPPEQAEDSKRVDARADVFGLGGVLYAVLTRRAPMDLGGLPVREALRRVMRCEIAPPASVDASIDPAMDAICRRALAREPESRFATAIELAEALDAWLAGDRTVREPPAGPEEQAAAAAAAGSAAPWVLVVLALLLLAGGIAVGLMLGRR